MLPPRPLAGSACLLLAAALLAGLNAAAGGGLSGLAAALSGDAEAPLAAVQLAHGWLPRLAISLLAGAALAVAGTVMQQVLRNPIAAPMTLGVAAGAQLGLSLATLFAPALLTVIAEPAAVAGAAAALAIVFFLAWRRRFEPVTLVLAGLVVSLYLGAINAGLLLFFEYDLQSLLIWGGGSLDQHDWSEVRFLLPRVAACAVLLLPLVRPLLVMTLDDDSARGLGVRLQRARLLALALAVYLAASVVTVVGVVGFVGLAAPALARLLGARTFPQRLVVAPLLGAGLLLLTDQAVQQLNTHTAALIPTGAVTALLGAPLLLWLLRQVHPGAPLPAAAEAGAPVLRAGAARVAMLAGATLLALVIALLLGRDAGGWRLDGPFTVAAEFPWRLPRITAAACAGVLLALAGTVLQRLLRNPLASPEVLGITSGALAGVVALALVMPAASGPALAGAGTAGGVATIAALLWFARHAGYAPERVLLAGIAVKAVFDGLLGLVAASGTPQWIRVLNWVSGSTYGTQWPSVTGGLVGVALLVPTMLALHRWLELLALGRDQAEARGLDVRIARLVLLLLAAVATALATLLAGPLSFIGLMAPHLARMLGFASARAQLAAAGTAGLAIMVTAEWAGRTLLAPYEWPAGLAAAFIGGLYFMWLLRRL